MDLVRLAIVYDTGQAAANLQQLDRQLAVVQGRTGTAHVATRGLEGALRSLAVQATGVPGPIGHIATAVGGMAVGMNILLPVLAAVAIGYEVLIARSKTLHEETEKLVKSFADASRAGAAFSFISAQSDLTSAQEQLRRMQERRAFIERNVNIGGPAGEALKTMSRLVAGVTDADMQDQASKIASLTNLVGAYKAAWERAKDAIIDANQPEWIRRQKTAMAEALRDFNTQRMNLMAQQGRPAGEPQFPFGTQFFADQYSHDLGELQSNVEGLVKAFDIGGIKFEDLGNASVGLKGKFDLAGKAVMDFVGFLAQAVGVLFPNDPQLGYALSGIASVASSAAHSTSTSPRTLGGSKDNLTSGMTTQVNFNIAAMDAQGVASFVQANGPQIAAEVTRQADRSRALRRRFMRG